MLWKYGEISIYNIFSWGKEWLCHCWDVVSWSFLKSDMKLVQELAEMHVLFEVSLLKAIREHFCILEAEGPLMTSFLEMGR